MSLARFNLSGKWESTLLDGFVTVQRPHTNLEIRDQEKQELHGHVTCIFIINLQYKWAEMIHHPFSRLLNFDFI